MLRDMQGRVFILCLLACAACAPRGEILYRPDLAAAGARQEVFLATSRAVDPLTGDFGADRVGADNYARYVVQVPPDREPGTISWPRSASRPDPGRHFLTVERQRFESEAEFRADVGRALAALPPAEREVRVFVHGFNTTFAEGLYRLAQLDRDLGFPGLSVHYAWPSRGKPLGYFADRDSSVFSRDGYERLLELLVEAGAERIIVVGHSMGSLVVMEALRDLAIGKNRKVLDRIGGVVLISPDIAVDVFQKEARRIGRLPQPFFVFASQRDKALRLSAVLSGRPDRLGNLTSPEEVAEFDIVLFDVTEFSMKSGHFTVGDSPALIALLGRIAELDTAMGFDDSRLGVLGGSITSFGNAQEVIVHAPVGKPGEH